jgi:predicted metal-binding protein
MDHSPDYDVHVFICQSCRYRDESSELCHPDTAAELKKRTKSLCKKEVSKSHLRVNSSGCLGQCETGINAIIYPQGRWMLNLRAGDEAKLFKAALAAFKDK